MADCSTSWWRRNAVKLALASTMSVGLAFGATAAYATEPTVPAETPAATIIEPAVISETEQVETIETATVEEAVVDDVTTAPATDTADVVTGGAALEGSVITTETTEDADDTKQPVADVEDQTANGTTDGDITTATDPDEGDESDDETKPGAGEEESDPTTDTDEETKPGEGEEGDDEKPGEDEGDPSTGLPSEYAAWSAPQEDEQEAADEDETPLYEDQKFVTREELENFGLAHLVKTSVLKPYMHGFFVPKELYRLMTDKGEVQGYDEWVRQLRRNKKDEEQKEQVATNRKVQKPDEDLSKLSKRQAKKRKEIMRDSYYQDAL